MVDDIKKEEEQLEEDIIVDLPTEESEGEQETKPEEPTEQEAPVQSEETVEEEEAEEEESGENAPISPVVTVTALLIAFFVFRKQK